MWNPTSSFKPKCHIELSKSNRVEFLPSFKNWKITLKYFPCTFATSDYIFICTRNAWTCWLQWYPNNDSSLFYCFFPLQNWSCREPGLWLQGRRLHTHSLIDLIHVLWAEWTSKVYRGVQLKIFGKKGYPTWIKIFPRPEARCWRNLILFYPVALKNNEEMIQCREVWQEKKRGRRWAEGEAGESTHLVETTISQVVVQVLLCFLFCP